jgi:hypothetical protein
MKKIGLLIAALLVMVASPARAQLVIGMYGDSTMYGSTLVSGAYVQSPNNIPAGVEWSLIHINGFNVTVENHGAGGTTCPKLLWGAPSLGIPRSWADEMAVSAAAIVVVNEGLNDGESDADFTWCYGQLWSLANQRGKIFVIQTPNPIANDPISRVAHLVSLERQVADQYGIFVIDEYTDILNNVVGLQSHLPDGIHPDDALYGYMGQSALRILAPLVALLQNH